MAVRILVADDEPHIRRLVELKLATAGYEIRAVGDAASALAEATRYIPHLIVTDFKMPGGMTGLDLIKSIRETPGIGEIPIIMLTGSVAVMNSLSEDLRSVRKVTLMPKPFSPRLFLKEVEKVLEGK